MKKNRAKGIVSSPLVAQTRKGGVILVVAVISAAARVSRPVMCSRVLYIVRVKSSPQSIEMPGMINCGGA
jgi:hypothetical protein